MIEGLWAALATARLDLQQFNRARVMVLLAVLEAITFLVLVSLFGLTGSRAPTALVVNDEGPLTTSFIEHLRAARHSFDLRPMTYEKAKEQMDRGDLVAIITIPEGFSADVAAGKTVLLPVTVDNVNADLTDDIREAVPSTITSFGRDEQFPGVRLISTGRDLVDRDTNYIAYLIVSALVLDAFVVAGILGAMAVTREFEAGTIVQWRLSPVAPGYLLLGKLLAAAAVASVAVALSTLIVIYGYGVTPRHIPGVIASLGLCVIIFTALGACIGAIARRTLPVASLMFGLALPLYLSSGALEPDRFDGEKVFWSGHASPVYSAIAVLQHGFHGFRVTPESLTQNFIVLCMWTVASVLATAALLNYRFTSR